MFFGGSCEEKKLVIGNMSLTSLAPLAARADELVDMAKKMYPHDNVQAINRPKSSSLLTAVQVMLSGRIMLVRCVTQLV